MLEFVFQRVSFSIFVLLIVSAMIFGLMRLIPGSPALIVLGADVTAEQITEFNHEHGFDRPIPSQYLEWLTGVIFRGDFGASYISGRLISPEIGRVFPVTAEIVAIAFLFCLSLAIPLGIVSATRSGGVLDQTARIFAILGVSIPGFWLGLMLIVYFAVNLRLFPPGGITPISRGLWLHLWSLVLPAFSVGIYYTAIISRMMRSSLLEALGRDYTRTAQAMGLKPRRVLLYAIKNALIPVVSVSAMAIGYMFGWAIIIEQVFNIGGMSRLLLTAIFQRDYNTVQAIVLVITAIFILANLIADILYRLLNPKTSAQR